MKASIAKLSNNQIQIRQVIPGNLN